MKVTKAELKRLLAQDNRDPDDLIPERIETLAMRLVQRELTRLGVEWYRACPENRGRDVVIFPFPGKLWQWGDQMASYARYRFDPEGQRWLTSVLRGEREGGHFKVRRVYPAEGPV